MPWPYTFCRYLAASVLLLYGFAKINGAQFTVLDSELDKPMGHVSGFWLTWYYFGYSAGYTFTIAAVEIAGALLLTIRRTTLLAACVLLPMLGNIVLVDLFYGVDLGGLLAALLATACVACIVVQHKAELIAVFWCAPRARDANVNVSAAARPRPRTRAAAMAVGVRAAMVLSATLFTYWLAHHNNRVPTPLDGRWQVMSGTYRAPDATQPLSHVYFELNRAHMCVLRFGDRWSRAHHFLVDTTTRTVKLWRGWNRERREEDRLFTGTYELDGDRLVLRGRFADAPEPAVLVLHRVGGGDGDPDRS